MPRPPRILGLATVDPSTTKGVHGVAVIDASHLVAGAVYVVLFECDDASNCAGPEHSTPRVFALDASLRRTLIGLLATPEAPLGFVTKDTGR